MARMRKIRLAVLVFGMSIGVAAQNNSQSQPETAAPAPAFGQSAPVLNPENPPVSGLDEPGLDLHTATRSFVSPALQVSESADTNGGNRIGSTGLQSVTHVLGALDLQQFWPKSDLFLEYLGGGAFYSSPYDAKQLHAVGLEAVTRWRTGQVTLRDSFSYLPDGAFQMGYGGDPGLGLATGGIGTGGAGAGLPGSHQFGSGQFGSVGNIPRLANTAMLDAVQALSPVSAVTVAGGFSNAHFYDPSKSLINSDQVTVQAGYSHVLSRHDQIGLIYGFQLFQFPQDTGGQIYNHIVNVRWSHTITGRLSLIAGAGPQYTDLQQGGYLTNWSLSARVQLRYKFSHSSVVGSYEKYTSSGSGFFAGADTQAARLGFTRSLGRTWDVYGDLSYSHNTKLQPANLGAANASSYDEGSAGAVFRKHLGRSYDFFAAYRFSEVAFNVPVFLSGTGGRISQRHIGTIGVEWHPKPTRIE
ncbi:MAG TPA: hypothetical protein VKD23_05835 [Terriglobales bacterium]|nr:hypothetical protein [Terriglobales bacterium]